MKAHVTGKTPEWWDINYSVPAGEKIVMRAASKEDGPVDHLITKHELKQIYKLYKVKEGPAKDSHDILYRKKIDFVKSAKDPLILEDMIFGR